MSVVVPFYNPGELLRETIESVLAQTYENIELVLVDDNSTDESVEIALQAADADIRVRVVRRERNGGVCAAFNTGFDAAKGTLLTRLAHDDVFERDALEVMGEVLERNPEVEFTYAATAITGPDVWDTPERVVVPGEDREPDPLKFGHRGLCWLFRREVWDRVGPFDRDFEWAEDYEWCIRMVLRCREKRCSERPLVRVRHHSGTATNKNYSIQQLRHVEALLKHRRIRRVTASVEIRSRVAKAFFDGSYSLRQRGLSGSSVKAALRAVYWAPRKAVAWKNAAGCVAATLAKGAKHGARRAGVPGNG